VKEDPSSPSRHDDASVLTIHRKSFSSAFERGTSGQPAGAVTGHARSRTRAELGRIARFQPKTALGEK
jgi:hypothetical protein